MNAFLSIRAALADKRARLSTGTPADGTRSPAFVNRDPAFVNRDPAFVNRDPAFVNRAGRPANLHPLHHGDRRMAQARAQALAVLLIVAAAPVCGALVAIILLTVRFQ